MANGNYKQVIKRFGQKVEERWLAVIQGTAAEMSHRVIHRTPVDTGRARGNWRPALNTIDQDFEENRFDPSGNARTTEAGAVARQMKLGDVFSLANSTPYIFPLEFEASSRQAPNGFVGITVAEFPLIVTEAARKGGKS